LNTVVKTVPENDAALLPPVYTKNAVDYWLQIGL